MAQHGPSGRAPSLGGVASQAEASAASAVILPALYGPQDRTIIWATVNVAGEDMDPM